MAALRWEPTHVTKPDPRVVPLYKPSSFHETSAFHSASVCCFAFLAFDLLAVSALAFACALSVSKNLQAALALVQGAQEVT